jgi:glucan 1,3-beta-glucosidase
MPDSLEERLYLLPPLTWLFSSGFDNSGHQGPANWATLQSNIDRTKTIIQSIAREFSEAQYADVVTALAILNEPNGNLNSQLLDAARQYSSEYRHHPSA